MKARCRAAIAIAVSLVALASNSLRADETGIASWYGSESGSRTASGERFDPEGMTAAHPSKPFGTKLKITVLTTGMTCIVRINDRGPARWTHRIIDLSKGAARACGLLHTGTARVHIQTIP